MKLPHKRQSEIVPKDGIIKTHTVRAFWEKFCSDISLTNCRSQSLPYELTGFNGCSDYGPFIAVNIPGEHMQL